MITEFGTNSPQTVKRWSKTLWRETIHKMWLKRLMGRGPNAVIEILNDLESSAGDTIKWDILLQMSQYGVTGDNEIAGFEEGLEYRQDEIKVDQRRIAHAFRRMSSQRTLHDLRMDARDNLADRWATIMDEMAFAYLAGTAGDNVALAAELPHGGNALENPVTMLDTDHVFAPGATFDTDHIDICYEKATTITPLMRPSMLEGEPLFVIIVHPFCITDLRTNTAANKWREITMNAGVRGSENPLFNGAIGRWGNVVIHSSPRIPRTAGVAHNLFLGAQAGAIAFANAFAKPKQTKYGTQNMMAWTEEEKDHGNRMSVAAGAVYGIKKATFDYTGAGKRAHGVIRLDNNAAAHG